LIIFLLGLRGIKLILMNKEAFNFLFAVNQ